MKNQITSALLLYMFLQGCVTYEKTSSRLAQSVDKGKSLVLFKDGKQESFENIVYRDSSYYGIKTKSSGSPQSQLTRDDEELQVFLNKPRVAKNVIYTSLSGYIMSGPGLSIAYEREIHNSLWLATAVGGFPLVEGGKKIDFKLMYLTGKKNSHLELDFGITLAHSQGKEEQVTTYTGTIPEVSAHWEVHPALSIGYRHQKPGTGPMLRFGVGYYEVYIGLGFRF